MLTLFQVSVSVYLTQFHCPLIVISTIHFQLLFRNWVFVHHLPRSLTAPTFTSITVFLFILLLYYTIYCIIPHARSVIIILILSDIKRRGYKFSHWFHLLIQILWKPKRLQISCVLWYLIIAANRTKFQNWIYFSKTNRLKVQWNH